MFKDIKILYLYILMLIIGSLILAFVGGLGYYYYKNRYNDEATELLTFVHDDLKCIKYQYRGKKYIYLTNKMEDDIQKIQKEIDPSNTEKDKLPQTECKNIMLKIKEKNSEIEYNIVLDDQKLLYAFIGPSNTYYFAFDNKFNIKLTKFMNYLFQTDEGALTYGHISTLLPPEKYFQIRLSINKFKKEDHDFEWSMI
jgi:hypothetical protein